MNDIQSGLKKSLIVARSSNKVIGRDNDLPWEKLLADMAYFQRLTFGKAVIMGRKTYESLPAPLSPLKHRVNIIVTRDPDYDPSRHSTRDDYNEIKTYTAMSLEAAFQLCLREGWLDPMVIGGGEIYKQALENNWVDRIYVTEIETTCEGNVFFDFDEANWQRVKHWHHEPFPQNPLPFSWDVYERVA